MELEGLKALVVDDDFNTCDSVTKMLIKVGMRSEWILSGKRQFTCPPVCKMVMLSMHISLISACRI
ncbi:MAG: hypothetical protein ACLVIY_10770 [Anaerobutyricum soehngenii]